MFKPLICPGVPLIPRTLYVRFQPKIADVSGCVRHVRRYGPSQLFSYIPFAYALYRELFLENKSKSQNTRTPRTYLPS